RMYVIVHLYMVSCVSVLGHSFDSFLPMSSSLFFFTDPAPTEIYTLSLHDALPISCCRSPSSRRRSFSISMRAVMSRATPKTVGPDRKSTRLNSSHLGISYAVFCLKKKKNKKK